MITVIGFPRSGTHWLKALLEATLKMDVTHSHPIPKFTKGDKYVFTVRDPRDTFISYYTVHLATTGIDTDITQEEFFHGYFVGKKQTQMCFKLGWQGYMEKWLERINEYGSIPWRSVAVTSHEQIKRDTAKELRKILFSLGYKVSDRSIDRAIVATEGVRWDPSPLPVCSMGTVGRWHGSMEPELVHLLWDYCGDVAERLGYQWEE